MASLWRSAVHRPRAQGLGQHLWVDADQEAASPAVDANARQRQDGLLHVDGHGLAQPEGRGAAHQVAAVALRHLGLAGLDLLAGNLPRQFLQADLAVAMHQHDQRLGALAGWHHASPFWVGVDADLGSWFAYRAVLLLDTALPVTPRREAGSPCAGCVDKPCISACPAGALASEQTGGWRLHACLDWRKQPGSSCLDRCLARNACPVGERYRYADQQIAYHYLHSMRHIREHC